MKFKITKLLAAVGALLLPISAAIVMGPSAHATAAPPIRVNANGPAYTDGSGNPWSADQAYATGSWGYDTLYGSGSTASTIAGTTDQTLYKSYNLFNSWTGYKFDVANGTYQVTLKMVEDWATPPASGSSMCASGAPPCSPASTSTPHAAG
jgi:Di-glucose binding within endoplasmic reticulum.